ncbi:MAG: hypothetical protein AMK72_12485 [Planctomycetes bacterium SM23_25]|nr:MAG: hypothetical protein AMK72_12485 [Planctomycetes bacterium SM23_25]
MCLSPLYGLMFAPAEKGQATHLLVRDGDVILAKDLSEFPYRSSDGPALKVGGDKTVTTLAGKPVALSLEQEVGWTWLKEASPEQMASLRLVKAGPEPPEGVDAEPLIKKLAGANAAIDLIVTDADALGPLLEHFDPAWLSIGGASLEKKHWAALAGEKRLRTLAMEGDEEGDLPLLACLSNLETLVLTNWHMEKAGPLPDGLASLRSLVVFGGKMKDLACLGKQPRLEELNLMAQKELTDINALAGHPHLKTVCLRYCEGVTDVAVLKQLEGLKWLAVPPATTQQQFAEIVRDHPGLTVLEASNCEKITDLAPVGDLRGLEALVVVTAAPPDPLYAMKHLKFLAVFVEEKEGKVKPEHQEMVVRLRKALPETAVVRVAPMCLGSGWILLLVPAVALGWWLAARRRRPEPGACHA